jgi:hypothetical protein
MLSSWLRTRRESPQPPHSFRPSVEYLSERIVPAIGTGAHFLYASSSLTDNGSLVIDFKEAGLGNVSDVPISVTGDAEAVYQWFNKGGNKPQGVPFSVSATIDVTQTFPVRNGQTTGTITIEAPPPPADFLTHPHAANWVPMYSVAYTNVVLTSYQGETQTATTAGEFNLDQSTGGFIPL